MSMLQLTDGVVFAVRYRIGRCIAMGGMGAVYEVVHLETERRRALKVMLPHLVQSSELRDRFRQEARVAAHIDSEFIVDVFDAGVDEPTGMPFLVMELLRGEELGKRLARLGKLEPEEAVRYLWQTALALDKTHRANIVHRDLKPENIFLAEREDGPPRVKVLDFGIAKFVTEGGTHANATRSIGTPLYMAPEQFRSGSKVSAATDVYALGMMAYTLLVGVPYWREEQTSEGSNVYAFVASVMNGPQEAATDRATRKGTQLHPGFDVWFGKAAARIPDERFSTATAAVQSLAEILGVPVPGTSKEASNTLARRTLKLPAVSSARTELTPADGSVGKTASTTRSERIETTPGTLGATPPPGMATGAGPWGGGKTGGGNAAQAGQPPKNRNGIVLGAVGLVGMIVVGGAAVYLWKRSEVAPSNDQMAALPAQMSAPPNPTVASPVSSVETPARMEAPADAGPGVDAGVDASLGADAGRVGARAAGKADAGVKKSVSTPEAEPIWKPD